ncbi:uncharacterized protein [Palaemon carinicauda]|uniref:uncharacterized protein n=1 Tax=Palaemon carinicauda TaxID=392227 RepID=UPI0035B63C85
MSHVIPAVVEWFLERSTLGKLAILDFGIQWTGFAFAYTLRTEKFYDLTGSSTFLLIAYLTYKWHNSGHPRQLIQTGCVSIWALRLGLYLFTRVLKDGKDRRFDKMRGDPMKFFVAWTLQGLWVFVTILPSVLAVLSTRQRPLGTRDYIGWGIWLIGYLIEVVADYQKSSFRNNPANKDKFINTGLWSLSRHPNYFGEILLWFGLYVSASSTFSGWEYLTILCPLMDYLLITKLSGIPFLERYARKKWGLLKQYQDYVEHTPVLVPFFS